MAKKKQKPQSMCRLGIPIRSLRDLQEAACDKKSVVCPSIMWAKRPQPASFVMYYPGNRILLLIRSGLYIYKRKTTNAKKGK